MFVVPLRVLGDLFRPELRPRLRPFEQMTVVPMPEAPVHEDHCPIFWQAQIRVARHVLAVNPVAKPACVKRLANHEFGLSVFAPDARHHPAAGRRIDDVSQLPPCAAQPALGTRAASCVRPQP